MEKSGESWRICPRSLMLVGYYIQKINEKGRTALPSRFKKELGETVILCRWFEGSLAIFGSQAWQSMVEAATKGSLVTATARDTQRFLLGGAYEIELDNQGRFVIPVALREYTNFVGEIVFIGLGSRVELWNRQRWGEREKSIIQNAEKLIEEAGK